MSALKDNGTSSSGTAGTVIAEIEAATGARIDDFTVAVITPADNTSSAQVVLTFTDDTTETLVLEAGASARGFVGNRAQLNGASSADQMTDVTKNVKKVSVQTNNTGTAQREAGVSGVQVR